jgi:hypothetical protein
MAGRNMANSKVVIAVSGSLDRRARETMWFREFDGPTIRVLRELYPDSMLVPVAMDETCLWSIESAR